MKHTYFIPNKLGRAVILAALISLLIVPTAFAQDGAGPGDELPFMDFETFVVWVQGLIVLFVTGVMLEKWAWFQGRSGEFKNRATLVLSGLIGGAVAYGTALVPDAWVGQFDVAVTSTYNQYLYRAALLFTQRGVP